MELAAFGKGLPDVGEAAWIAVGERAEDGSVHDAENRGVRSDAESERDDGGEGHGGSAAQRAQAVPGIVKEVEDPTDAPGIAARFADLFRSAEGDAGAPFSFGARDTGGAELLGVPVEVEAEFVLQLGFHGVAAEERAETVCEIAKHGFPSPNTSTAIPVEAQGEKGAGGGFASPLALLQKGCYCRSGREERMEERLDLPQGTLDLLILKALALEPLHGWGVSERLEQISKKRCRYSRGRSIPRSTAWSVVDGSRPSGRSPRTTAGPSTTSSRAPDANTSEVETAAWRKLSNVVGQVLDMA